MRIFVLLVALLLLPSGCITITKPEVTMEAVQSSEGCECRCSVKKDIELTDGVEDEDE